MKTKEKKYLALAVVIIFVIACWALVLIGFCGISADSSNQADSSPFTSTLKYANSTTLVECSCGGTGECKMCEGDGIRVRAGRNVTCQYCGGSGKHELCGGTGKVDIVVLRETQEKVLESITHSYRLGRIKVMV